MGQFRLPTFNLNSKVPKTTKTGQKRRFAFWRQNDYFPVTKLVDFVTF